MQEYFIFCKVFFALVTEFVQKRCAIVRFFSTKKCNYLIINIIISKNRRTFPVQTVHSYHHLRTNSLFSQKSTIRTVFVRK